MDPDHRLAILAVDAAALVCATVFFAVAGRRSVLSWLCLALCVFASVIAHVFG